MGRPSKTGLDYFSLDCVLDDKVDLLEAELGLEGFAILIKLWMKIYSNGYYIEWSDDIELLFARKINSEKTLVSSVINSCFSRKILNKTLYAKYSILTSKGIQNRFFTACKICKRKMILVNSDFILVNPEEIGINPDFIEFTQGESTQKKRKERKVKEKKKYLEFVYLTDDEFEKLEKKFSQQGAMKNIEKLNNYIGSKGKKYKSHYHTILSWHNKDQNQEQLTHNYPEL